MSIQVPEKHWWAVPLDKDEKTWVTVALIWALVLTVAMPWWHFTGAQNTSKEYYRVSAEAYDRMTDEFIQQNQVGEEAGIPVVAPAANADVFVRATQFSWEPVLKLKVNQTYRIHLSSLDVNHGFSVQPVNLNFQVVPGWDHVLTITPTTTGEFFIVCNEFCGIGHHNMIGKIIVES